MISEYNQNDVVLVPFPFTDKLANKRRPALILSDDKIFNIPNRHSVMAMITTTTHTSWELDVRISDIESAGLEAPSIVRMKLFTLDHELIVKRIGRLSYNDIEIIRRNINLLFSE